MKHTILIGSIVTLLVFSKLTEAIPYVIPDSLRDISDAEKILTDPKFEQAQEQRIYNSLDEDDLLAKNTLETIKQIARTIKPTGAAALALDIAIKGVLETVSIVVSTKHAAKIALDQATELVKSGQIEAALETLKKGLQVDREMIFISGVPVHDAQGAALSLVGGALVEAFKKAIVFVQRAGTAIFQALKLADEISTLGAKAGGEAALSAFKAARKSINAGVKIVDKHLTDLARVVVEHLQKNADSKIPAKEDMAESIVSSFKTQNSTDNRDALLAIARLDKNLNSTLPVLPNWEAIGAARVIHQGLLATIKKTANAVSVAKQALVKAGRLVGIDPELAIAAVHRGIRAAEDEILNGSGPGYLGLGAAGQMTNKQVVEKLVPAVVEVEYGRVSAFEELVLAERAALLGILSGGDAAAEGIEAAKEICDAAGIILYQDYADAGEMGFDVLRGLPIRRDESLQ